MQDLRDTAHAAELDQELETSLGNLRPELRQDPVLIGILLERLLSERTQYKKTGRTI